MEKISKKKGGDSTGSIGSDKSNSVKNDTSSVKNDTSTSKKSNVGMISRFISWISGKSSRNDDDDIDKDKIVTVSTKKAVVIGIYTYHLPYYFLL